MTFIFKPTCLSAFVLLSTMVSCERKESILLEYPQIKTVEVIDNYFGNAIADPYRNLENLKDEEISNWFKKQSELSDSILEKIPNSDLFYRKMIELENSRNQIISYMKINEDGSYFYLKQPKSEKIEKLFFKKSKNANEELIFNPTTYKKNYIINYYKASWDLSKVAIALSEKGEDKSEVIIYDMIKKTILPDLIEGLSPSLVGEIEWFPDNTGFFYLHIPHFNYDSADYLLNTIGTFYKIGEYNSKLKNIFSRKANRELSFQKGDFPILRVKNKNRPYLFGSVANATDFSDTYYSYLDPKNSFSINWNLLFTKDEKIIQYDLKDNHIIFRTAKNASNFKICRTPFLNPNFDNPEILVNERANEVINDFEYVNGNLYFTTLKNGVSANFYKISNGKEKLISLPKKSGSISVHGFGKTLIVVSSGWTIAKSYFNYDYENNIFEDISLDKYDYPQLENLIVEEVEVDSHDGTKIPLSLVYSKNMKKSGLNRTLMISYGAYGVSYRPSITIPFITWALQDGILAIAHIRGGGEKGNNWYMGGFKSTKPNSWKDLISCSEYLIENKYTSSNLMVNFGISAGGIPVGRSITERPDLFEVAIMDSPSLNMLRSEFQPNGPGNIAEFGTVKDSSEFLSLATMDSYYNLEKDTEYPALLINVGMNDGIVPPWDSGKFIAKVQNMTSSKKPALISINYNSGHGGDGTLDNVYRNMSNLYSFAYWQTKHPKFQIDQSDF